MSPSPTYASADSLGGPTWAARAFIVEAIVLLAFLIASSAVFVQMASASIALARESETAAAAVSAATATAERFAADPTDVGEITRTGDLVVVCVVSSSERAGGTLYHADIEIYKSGDVPAELVASGDLAGSGVDSVYAILTAAYVSEASRR